MVQEITAEDQVIDLLRGAPLCDLDEVMRRCPTFTWNQIVLPVDHLSCTRQIRLMRAKGGRYTVTCLRPQGTQANGEAYPINASLSEPDYQDEDVHLGAESFIRRVA
jgi:hypothetical protein